MENQVIPLELEDGYQVETVFYGSGTLCISSQAGCRMACPFCASGRNGLVRNLTLTELFRQTELYSSEDISRITISGVGEPLENIDNIETFIEKSPLPVSVTTAVPDAEMLKRLLSTNHNGVMLSLHAGSEEIHKKMVPKALSLSEIYTALDEVWKDLSRGRRRKIGFNYLLAEGINDTDEETELFTETVSRYAGTTVHLLYLNQVEKSPYKSPDSEKVNTIYEQMKSKGLNVRRANNWRKSRKGGCGTLWLKSLSKKY